LTVDLWRIEAIENKTLARGTPVQVLNCPPSLLGHVGKYTGVPQIELG